MRQGFRTIVGRALKRRCPACGNGPMFRSFSRLAPSCSSCGWIFEREPGTVTGAMYLISMVTQIFAAALFLVIWLATDWSNTTKLLIGLPPIALFSYLMAPFARALWVGVDYYTDIAAGETERPDYQQDAFAPNDEGDEAAR